MKILECEYDQWDEARKKAKQKKKKKPQYQIAKDFKNFYAK